MRKSAEAAEKIAILRDCSEYFSALSVYIIFIWEERDAASFKYFCAGRESARFGDLSRGYFVFSVNMKTEKGNLSFKSVGNKSRTAENDMLSKKLNRATSNLYPSNNYSRFEKAEIIQREIKDSLKKIYGFYF